MNSQFPLNYRKLGSDKYDADRVSKTLKKIEHILDWQPSTYCTSVAETQTRSRTAGHPAFPIETTAAAADRCWNTVNESYITEPRLGFVRENDLTTAGDVNDRRVALGHKRNDHTKRGLISDQKYLRLTGNTDKRGHIERENIWKSTEDDAGCGCETAPIPADRTRPFEMRYLEKTTPKLSTNPNLGYSCDVGQLDCHGNVAESNYATGCLETSALNACFSDSESDLCCRRYGFSRRRSAAECCEKHRANTSTLSPDICRHSLRGVLSTTKDHSAREPLQQHHLETSANMESNIFGWVKRRNSWVSVPMSDPTRSVEVAETKKVKEDLNLSSPHLRDVVSSQEAERSVILNRGLSPDMAGTATSKKDIKWENPVQPGSRPTFRTITENSVGNRRGSFDSRRSVAFESHTSPNMTDTTTFNKVFNEDNPFQPVSKPTPNGENNRRGSFDSRRFVAFESHTSPDMTGTATSNKSFKEEIPIQPASRPTPNSESNRRGSLGLDERTFVPENRRDIFAREDRRKTSRTYPEAESYVQRQVFETTFKTAGESSMSDADRGHSRSSTDSHGMYGQSMPSLNKRPSTGETPPYNHSKSMRSPRRRSTSAKRDRRRQRVSDSDCDCPTPAVAVSSEKSWSAAFTSKDIRRKHPDSEELLTMLENQATMFCAVEAENKFLQSELISVRRMLGSLVEENSVLHERLKQRLVDELLSTSEDVDRAQDMHRQGSTFVMSLAANSPQSGENNAALSRLLTKYDFQKVKKEFETIIRLHRVKSGRMEAQLKFSRSEIQRLQLEATDLQRKLGCKDSFLPVDKLTRNSAVGLCVRCCNQQASVVLCTDTSDNCRQTRQLIKDRDELMERVLSAKSVCSFAMDREAELYGHWSSFIINFETAQLEVLEALRQRDDLRDELNRVAQSTRDDLQKERSCWKHQMEREQAESEQRNVELVRKNEELLSEVENQNRKLCKNQRERDILQEKCESISCQIMRIENDYTKEIEELRKSLCKLTHERDDAIQLVRMLEHQVVMAKTASDQQQCCKEPEQPVDGVLEKFSSLETHINSKVDQLQEYYGQALRDRDDVIQQQTTLFKKLKKKYCRVKRRLRQSRRKQKKTATPESKNQQKKCKTETL